MDRAYMQAGKGEDQTGSILAPIGMLETNASTADHKILNMPDSF